MTDTIDISEKAVEMEYRVREGRVEVCDGHRCWRDRRYIAERRVSFFGVLSWWWPVINGDWRTSAHEARDDAEMDAKLRAPLADPEFFQSRNERSDGTEA
ncbi:MAG: hypothetical protein PHX82_15860 [Paracoccaceae bacterium]|nr:hypothetical protein [Paracoccaceae bacterium]